MVRVNVVRGILHEQLHLLGLGLGLVSGLGSELVSGLELVFGLGLGLGLGSGLGLATRPVASLSQPVGCSVRGAPPRGVSVKRSAGASPASCTPSIALVAC